MKTSSYSNQIVDNKHFFSTNSKTTFRNSLFIKQKAVASQNLKI